MKKETTADRLKKLMSERNLKQVDILNLSLPVCARFNVKMNKSDIMNANIETMPATEAERLSTLYNDKFIIEISQVNDLIEKTIYRGERCVEISPFSLVISTISDSTIEYLRNLGYKVESKELLYPYDQSILKFWYISW